MQRKKGKEMIPITIPISDYKKYGLKYLGKGYNGTITSSTKAFTVPVGTRYMRLSVTTAAVAFDINGGTAAADQSITYPAGVYFFAVDEAQLAKCTCISATGKFQVEYFGSVL